MSPDLQTIFNVIENWMYGFSLSQLKLHRNCVISTDWIICVQYIDIHVVTNIDLEFVENIYYVINFNHVFGFKSKQLHMR